MMKITDKEDAPLRRADMSKNDADRKSHRHGGVERFGVSIDKDLLAKFDSLLRRRNYRNRSEAIRDLMRSALIDEEWHAGKKEVVGMISLLYNHHTRLLQSKLTDIQHAHHLKIISTVHVHLDHHNCLEVMVVRGKAAEINDLASKLISVRGVKHGKVIATSTGSKLQ
jgi:CopG family nickel-responsive transcriptional regulator